MLKKIACAVLALSLVFTGCSGSSSSEGGLTDGTYTGTGRGRNGDITVEVVVAKGAVSEIAVTDHTETAGIADPALEKIPAEIIEAQSLAVDNVSGATLTSNGIIEAVKACLVDAGADIDAWTKSDDTQAEKTAKSADADLVVVGAGISGMSTALSAKENGVDNIVIIEKQAAAGGTTALAGGIFIYVDDDTYDEFYDYWQERMSVSGVENKYFNEDRFAYIAPKTAETVEWLKGKNVAFNDETTYGSFGNYIMAWATNGGRGLVQDLVKACEEAGITIITDCKGTELVTTDGKVTGVVAETADEIITYTSKAVVLASGGSGANEEMTAEKSPKVAAAGTINTGCAGNTGDGVVMAEAVGGVAYDEFFTSIAAQTIDPKVENGDKLDFASALIVNGKGERFVKEDASDITKEYDALASAMIQNGNAPYYVVFDSSNKDRVAILEAGLESGAVVKADTIEELRNSVGMDAATLQATYDAYEEAVAAGEDKEFGKAADKLVALETAPYYAVQIFPTTFGSQGGVKTDFDGRVLDKDGNAIAGLYAVGEMSNREFYNENYVLAASLGLYSTAGRLCGVALAQDIAE